MSRFLKSLPILITAFLLTQNAGAFQAGWRQISVAGPRPEAPATTVALYYPTQTLAGAIPMGPFTPHVASQAAPESTVKGLIVLRDNWQDQSLLNDGPETYFNERPRQVSWVIDALLHDPQWKDRIARDDRGPRVGAVGHSAGGYTVLALAGGQPDMLRIAKHCDADRADDPVFCGTGRIGQPMAQAAAPPPASAPLADRRVRAVVALAPVGAVFTAQSLAKIRLPVAVYEAEKDRWLVPRFHAEWIAQNLPGAELHRVPNAWHFAFMDTPSMAIPTKDGDIRADPPGFDRSAFLKQLARDLPAFIDKAFR